MKGLFMRLRLKTKDTNNPESDNRESEFFEDGPDMLLENNDCLAYTTSLLNTSFMLAGGETSREVVTRSVNEHSRLAFHAIFLSARLRTT